MPTETEDYAGVGTPEDHATSHESGGSDEVSRANLVDADHATSHESGGSDQVSRANLVDADHASEHEAEGADEIAATGLVGRINFVDRGDFNGWDFVVSALTTDGNWYDLNLSSIVPAGTIAVLLRSRFRADYTNLTLKFRKNGNLYESNVDTGIIAVSNVYHFQTFWVFCDANRFIEYQAADGTWTNLDICIRAWLI